MALQYFRMAEAVPVVESTDGGESIAISGMVVPWHTEFSREGQRFTFTPESLWLPDDLRTVKLLLEHDPERPIGFAVSADSDATGLNMAFELPSTFPRSSDAAIEFAARLRDGFSVGVEPSNETLNALFDAMTAQPSDKALPFTGTLREVSTVTIPQFNNARGKLENSFRPLITLATTKDRDMTDIDAFVGRHG